ncbi:MAG: ATP-binding protein, partial [Patulibacter sp.]|nr:ATP-binding protein [Patulibacter sp.]
MPAAGAPRSAAAVLDAIHGAGLLGDAVVGPGPVLLMCSAGRDSHTLLDAAVRLRGAEGVRVLHVDHGLRAGAADDAAQMQARCAELGVAVT